MDQTVVCTRKLTLRSWSEVGNVERREEQLIGSTECEQNGSHVVESHEGVGREVSDLVRRIPLDEGGVHLYPVAGYVQGHHQLEQEEVGGVEVAQDQNQTCCRTPTGGVG